MEFRVGFHSQFLAARDKAPLNKEICILKVSRAIDKHQLVYQGSLDFGCEYDGGTTIFVVKCRRGNTA